MGSIGGNDRHIQRICVVCCRFAKSMASTRKIELSAPRRGATWTEQCGKNSSIRLCRDFDNSHIIRFNLRTSFGRKLCFITIEMTVWFSEKENGIRVRTVTATMANAAVATAAAKDTIKWIITHSKAWDERNLFNSVSTNYFDFHDGDRWRHPTATCFGPYR